ncbi:MAG: hybrid sensor histidine kinase/response regulator [Porphyrobacter sp.]|nr:hybrid sensor histidine kinase/response regulator [Porphyrobacter sp.]
MSKMPPIHFLLVDDLEENLLSLEAVLKGEEVVLLKARSGDEALELLLRHDVALALLDVHMPNMDGFELAEFMRGNERTRHIPIIFVTAGTADAQRRFRGYEAGAVDFIQKPIEPDVLRSKAKVFFDLHRQRQVVAAQRDKLETASQGLLAADRRKNEFLAVLAHELRNPVASLHGGLTLLERHEGTDRTVGIREEMRRRVHHLERLVEDLLDISRITEGKISLQKDRIELRTVLEHAMALNREQLNASGHDFSFDLPDGPVWLEADLVRMTQVVSNLLSNAVKYTPPGGSIALRARCEDDWAEIAVEDNGLGIPADQQEQIFEIFGQIEAHRQQSEGGLGIGLSLVRQIVQLHGGSISVASAGEGQGSTFTVRVPAVCEEALSTSAEAAR